MAQPQSRVALSRSKQPRFKVATDENTLAASGTRPRLVNITANKSSFLDKSKKLVASAAGSTATAKNTNSNIQRNALGEINNLRKKEPLKEKEVASKASTAVPKEQPPASGLKRRRSPSLHAATARPARIPNPPATTSVSTTTALRTAASSATLNKSQLEATTTSSIEQPAPQRRLSKMLQAINTRRQSQVIPPRPANPTNSNKRPLSTSSIHLNVSSNSVTSTTVMTKASLNVSTTTTTTAASLKLPPTVKARPVSTIEFPSSVLPSSRAPSPVPTSDLNDEEESEATNAADTDDAVTISRPRIASTASAVRVESVSEPKPLTLEDPAVEKKDPVKDLENWSEGDWLWVPEGKRKEYQGYIEKVCAGFVDEAEEDDATMVSEYADEIFQYMSKLEEESMPMPDYMNGQQEINWQMRATLIDWLLQVHLRYHMLPETLWIAINIIDRFLSRRVVSVVKLQLVGVTAMFIAAKYEEIIAPSVDEYVKMTEGGYKKDEILKGEKIILQTIDFRISSYCSPYSWVRRISKADDYNLQTRTLCKFLIELTLLDWRFLRAKPSLIAAIGMYSARKMLGQDWNDAFVYYSGRVEEELLIGHEFILETLSQSNFETQYIFKKYMSKRFLKASTYAREWALQNWNPPISRDVIHVRGEEVVEKRARVDSRRLSGISFTARD